MSRPIVFVGPSGIGKGTIERALMEKYPDQFSLAVSHTTRPRREHEIEGKHYYFTTREQMEKDIADGKFLEFCEIHGNLYGTSFKAIHDVQNNGHTCILDINIDGAFAFKKTDFNPFIIFLLPTSVEALESRLRGRGTDSDEVVQIRMNTAKRELERYEENKEMWDLAIVNDTLEKTLATIEAALHEIKVL